ncbi:hypothetical protein, partial [Corynebacterium spheniscorum]|uniref:hypothetical protein n=1 Tax=Corynebacterium spheniscorum TaxID=185761 RepID=UPI001C430E07
KKRSVGIRRGKTQPNKISAHRKIHAHDNTVKSCTKQDNIFMAPRKHTLHKKRMPVLQGHPAHNHTRSQTQTPCTKQTKVHQHTIEFSNIKTNTHTNPPTKTGDEDESKIPADQHTNLRKRRPQPVMLTPIKLHTPTTLHKPPAQPRFFEDV